MTAATPRLGDYLGHVIQAVERIGRYTGGLDAQQFAASEMLQDAVVRNLEVIGEACRNIEREAPGFVAAHPELPLSAAYEMRNVLAHGYFKVDLEIVWNTVQNDLPALRDQLLAILSTLMPAKTAG